MRIRKTRGLLMLPLLAGSMLAVASAGAAVAAAGPEPALIPRDVLFGNPDKAGTQLSPDGKYISYLADVGGVLNVFVAPTGELAKAKAVTKDTKRNIRQYFWAFDNQHILYLQDAGGDENWKVYCVDVATGQAKDLTPFETIPGPDGKPVNLPNGKPLRPTAQVVHLSEKFPQEILIGLNNRNPQYHDVYRLNIATGELKLLRQNDEFAGFTADDDYKLRFAQKMTADGGSEISRIADDGSVTPFEKIAQADSLTTGIAGFDASGQTLYWEDSRGRDTAALFAVNVADGKKTLVAEDARADVGGTLADPRSKKVQAASFTYGRTEWKVLDAQIKADLDYLKTVAPGEVIVADRTQDDKRWIVAFTMDDGPAKVYLYDRPGGGKPGKATFLYTNRSKLEGLPLAKMQDIVIKSRDGLNLVSYLTLPPGSDADGNGRPDKPVPMVLDVHGGPWARDSWGYNPYHQWLANRGYAVLSVNFRGSTGFGKNFTNAGNREWAGKMHDDLIDAVNWSVKEGVADKDKVAIMGGSYGGYATLVGLTFTPDTFACGVDIVGPSSIATLLNTIPPYWQPMIELFTERVGDHRTEEGRKFLDSRSPLTHVDKIKKPLLIGQGANDPRVKQTEADQIVAAMQAKKIPVTYVLFPDEGHGFARPENNTAFNAVTEAFLSKHLGGRYQPIGDDVSKSTAQIKVGGDGVPGLGSAGK